MFSTHIEYIVGNCCIHVHIASWSLCGRGRTQKTVAGMEALDQEGDSHGVFYIFLEFFLIFSTYCLFQKKVRPLNAVTIQLSKLSRHWKYDSLPLITQYNCRDLWAVYDILPFTCSPSFWGPFPQCAGSSTQALHPAPDNPCGGQFISLPEPPCLYP